MAKDAVYVVQQGEYVLAVTGNFDLAQQIVDYYSQVVTTITAFPVVGSWDEWMERWARLAHDYDQ